MKRLNLLLVLFLLKTQILSASDIVKVETCSIKLFENLDKALTKILKDSDESNSKSSNPDGSNNKFTTICLDAALKMDHISIELDHKGNNLCQNLSAQSRSNTNLTSLKCDSQKLQFSFSLPLPFKGININSISYNPIPNSKIEVKHELQTQSKNIICDPFTPFSTGMFEMSFSKKLILDQEASNISKCSLNEISIEYKIAEKEYKYNLNQKSCHKIENALSQENNDSVINNGDDLGTLLRDFFTHSGCKFFLESQGHPSSNGTPVVAPSTTPSQTDR